MLKSSYISERFIIYWFIYLSCSLRNFEAILLDVYMFRIGISLVIESSLSRIMLFILKFILSDVIMATAASSLLMIASVFLSMSSFSNFQFS